MPRKRGPKGMGSIRQRKDGTWEGRYYVSLPDGRRERRSVYGATEREVTVAVRRALREADQGLAPAKLGITVGQLLEDWLAMKRGAVKARTWEHYADKVRLYLLPYLGKIQLTSLKVTDLKRMYDALGQRLAPRTVHHAHRVLHNALQYAVRMGLTGRNVAAMIDAPRVPEQEMEALRFAEAQRVLEAARGDRYEALWTLALCLGLRQGELLGLMWDDVDFEAETLSVRRQLLRRGGTWWLDTTKTPMSRATLPLVEPALSALKRHRMRQAEERLRLGDAWQQYTQGQLIFTTEVGTPVDASRLVNRQYRRLLEHAGVRHVPFHSLRHTTATLLLELGYDLEVVKQILRHTSINLTSDTYAHVRAIQRDALRELGRRLGAGENG